jgi:hypothetical protein
MLEPYLLRLLVDRIAVVELELAAVTRRLAAIEAAPVIRYAGIWKAGQRYPRGTAITHDGALWIAEAETEGERPGSGPTAWKLAVKSGNGAMSPSRLVRTVAQISQTERGSVCKLLKLGQGGLK